MSAKVENIRRHRGIAGQFSVTADVTYPDEPMHRAEFVGSSYGGPVVLVLPSGAQTFLDAAVVERCGSLDREPTTFVRRFFGEEG